MKFVDENGKKHNSVFFDGYHIAERKLEGVMIDVSVSDDGKITCSFREGDASYLEDFNTKKFLKMAEGYVQDVLDEGEFVMLNVAGGAELDRMEYDDGTPFAITTPPSTGFSVTAMKLGDIFK